MDNKLTQYTSALFFLVVAVLILLIYGGINQDYFFSDDFHWLGRAVIAQESPLEMLRIEGRDFNPVFLFILWLLIKIFGLSLTVLRGVAIVVFILVIWLFYYVLQRYFNVDRLLAGSIALLFGFNVYLSEVVLNLSALVYSLAIAFFLGALLFYFQGKRAGFVFFLVLAFLTKETIMLGAVALLFYEKEPKQRWFITRVGAALIVLRVLAQWGGTGSYTDFFSFSDSLYKLYFIFIRSMNLSPYGFHLAVGIAAIILIILASIYFWKSRKVQGVGFFLVFFVGYAVFFALLPRLSSRYFLFPSIGFWGITGLVVQYYETQRKSLKYVLLPLLLISFFLNMPQIQREVADYRILGKFYQQYIQVKGGSIRAEVEKKSGNQNQENPVMITLYKESSTPLAGVFQEIVKRQNLPKLLPFRAKSIGGVIEPRFLIPLVFYPGKIARWELIEETTFGFTGKIIFME